MQSLIPFLPRGWLTLGMHMEKAFGYNRKHHSECMTIAEDGYSAFRNNKGFDCGVVYSDRPVNGDCEFEVEITSYDTFNRFVGSIMIGIMRCQDQMIPTNVHVSYTAKNHFVWSTNRFFNGSDNNLYGKKRLDSLRQGDRVGLHITEGGDLSYSVNGEDQGVAMRGVYEKGWDVYIVVDHYAKYRATKITKARLGSSQLHHAIQVKDQEIQQLKDQMIKEQEIQQLKDQQMKQEIQQLKNELKDSEETVAKFQQANVTLTGTNQSLTQAVQKLHQDNDRYKHLLQANQPHWVVQGSEVKMTEEVLGKGSWGEIKVAIFRGTRVAAKCLHEIILSEYNLELFSREMEIAARVRHPNLLQFIGATRETPPIILSEIMPTSLYKELQKSRFTQPQIVSISRHVALALNYLHLWKPQPIIHRDISSPNILLEAVGSGQWKAKVSDYGSANLQHQVKTEGPGNPSYAAPESRYPDEHSPAMDVYSYGVLLTEMIICRPPDMTTAGRLQQVERIEWPPMKSLVQHCVNHKRNERFSMNQVLETLKQI